MSVDMYQWACDLWPMPRSITGQGVRDTLAYLKTLLPDLRICSVPSGTQAFDWTIPDEWECRSAYIADLEGGRFIDWNNNNLHVVGYSTPVCCSMTREQLEPHLYTSDVSDDAIPYVTSYYKRRWGFCLSKKQKDALGDGPFVVIIDSDIGPGRMDYGELIIRGETDEEVLLSTYICHPMMANNELSGIVVTAALAQWIKASPRRLTYRILFIPETIGSIYYLSRHINTMKRKTIAGFVITCVGYGNNWHYLPSRDGRTVSDRVADYVLKDFRHTSSYPIRLDYMTDRGSDERQYCSPGVDLPVCSIMRSPYGRYKEYHTSLDNLDLISSECLEKSLDVYKECLRILEINETWVRTQPCEPFLSKHGLSSGLSTGEDCAGMMLNITAYADGTRDLLSLADAIEIDDVFAVDAAARLLQECGILKPKK